MTLDNGERPAEGESRDLQLEEFLDMLPYLEPPDLMAVTAAYSAGDAAARDATRERASAAARARGLLDELGRLQGSIIQWAGADMSQSAAYTFAAVRPDAMLGDVRVASVPALLDAATALLLDDALSADDRALLLEPIGAVTG